MTLECDVSPLTLSCVRCGAKVSAPRVRRNCAAASSQSAEHESIHTRASLPLPPPPAHGPGTELSKLLKRFRIEPTPTCSCRAKAAEMDAWGCDEASKPERIDEVVAVMRAEAQARGLPFLDAAGRLLVRRAIANARRLA